MSSDESKDYVLQYLLAMQRSLPQRHIGYPKAMIINDEVDGIDRPTGDDAAASIGMAIDYLEDEGYIKAQTQQHVKFFRLTSKAQDKLLSPSAYSRGERNSGSIRLFNNGGVVVLGDNYGTITIDKRIQITTGLEELAGIIRAAGEMDDIEKTDLIQSIATIEAQIKKSDPDKNIVRLAWDAVQSGLQTAATLEGATQLVTQLAPLIHHVIH
jgi:hypothetical protein